MSGKDIPSFPFLILKAILKTAFTPLHPFTQEHGARNIFFPYYYFTPMQMFNFSRHFLLVFGLILKLFLFVNTTNLVLWRWSIWQFISSANFAQTYFILSDNFLSHHNPQNSFYIHPPAHLGLCYMFHLFIYHFKCYCVKFFHIKESRGLHGFLWAAYNSVFLLLKLWLTL